MAVSVQPLVVPVTVYKVVAEGETKMLLLFRFPGIQLYDDAPVADNWVVLEEQITPLPARVSTGNGFTVTVTDWVAEHPPEVPVAV